MHPTVLVAFFTTSPLVIAMCSFGAAILVIGAWAAKHQIATARGLDKIVALSNLCYAAPLAVFSALHFFDPHSLLALVPRYMPWRMFWVYFVGCALLAASLSIASKIGVRWSGLLVGTMMFLFVAMIYLPSGLRHLDARITWTIVFRESSFGGAGWVLAGIAVNGWPRPVKSTLITVGRTAIAIAAIFFGIQHFLHPMGLPGVPLQKEMPAWVPARAVIDYLTGAALLVAGASILLNRKTRTIAASAGAWILLTVLVIYGPVMILALAAPDTGVKVEGIDYFADTLLFVGAILAAASAAPTSAGREKAAVSSS